MLIKFVLPIVGVLFLILTYILLRGTLRFVQEGQAINALIVKLEAASSQGYFPVFEYEIQGQQFQSKPEKSSPRWANRQGTQAKIIVDRSNPEKIKVFSFGGLLLAPIATSCIAAILLIISGWYYWYQGTFPVD